MATGRPTPTEIANTFNQKTPPKKNRILRNPGSQSSPMQREGA